MVIVFEHLNKFENAFCTLYKAYEIFSLELKFVLDIFLQNLYFFRSIDDRKYRLKCTHFQQIEVVGLCPQHLLNSRHFISIFNIFISSFARTKCFNDQKLFIILSLFIFFHFSEFCFNQRKSDILFIHI